MTKITKVAAALGIVAGLAVSALPLTSYAAAEDVLVTITINSTLGTEEAACDTASTSGAAGVQLDASCAYSSSSNSGLAITIKDKDAVLNLVHTNGTDTIVPIAAQEAATGVLTQNGWGWKFVNLGGTATAAIQGNRDRFSPITASDVAVVNATTAGTVTGDFMFSVRTPATQAPGAYSDTVVVTTTAQ